MRQVETLLLIVASVLLLGCASSRGMTYDRLPSDAEIWSGKSTSCVVAPQTPDETRVLDQLRAQKVITAKTQILSTRWNQSRHEWQIDLLHAGGLRTRWFSDSVGYNYTGGSLKR